LPAISIPCGFTKEGLPIGMQIISRAWGDAKVLNAAYAFEQATDWHKKFPKI
jgi:aspartyl-tRNA(Asn)/glutamyl-tRNA(Gln) amidotransferase subunit A